MRWRKEEPDPEPAPVFVHDLPFTGAPPPVTDPDDFYLDDVTGLPRSRRDDKIQAELAASEERHQRALREARDSERPRLVQAPVEDLGDATNIP